MKRPWTIYVILILSWISIVGSLLFAGFTLWLANHVPQGEFWEGVRKALVMQAGGSESESFSMNHAAYLHGQMLLPLLGSVLALFFTYKRILWGIRVVFMAECIFALGSGGLPFISGLLLVLSFLKPTEAYCKRTISN